VLALEAKGNSWPAQLQVGRKKLIRLARLASLSVCLKICPLFAQLEPSQPARQTDKRTDNQTERLRAENKVGFNLGLENNNNNNFSLLFWQIAPKGANKTNTAAHLSVSRSGKTVLCVERRRDGKLARWKAGKTAAAKDRRAERAAQMGRLEQSGALLLSVVGCQLLLYVGC